MHCQGYRLLFCLCEQAVLLHLGSASRALSQSASAKCLHVNAGMARSVTSRAAVPWVGDLVGMLQDMERCEVGLDASIWMMVKSFYLAPLDKMPVTATLRVTKAATVD